MPYEEFNKWLLYFEQRPSEWRSDLRASYLMNAFGVKKSPAEIFPSLKSLNKNSSSNSNFTKSLANSLIFNKMLSAKNGDSLSILKDIK